MRKKLHDRAKGKPYKPYLIGVLILIIAAAIYLFYFAEPSSDAEPDATKQADSSAADKSNGTDKSDISLYATGDWIAHDSINSAAKTSSNYDYLKLIKGLDDFKRADIRFCNDPILNGGSSLGISGYPKFNSPTKFVADMGRFGCNLVNTASNHSFDFSQANIDNSVKAWQKVPDTLAVAGQNANKASHDKVNYFTIKGVKFAFLTYTTYLNLDAPAQNNYGVNVFSRSFAKSQIKQAKKNGAQIIITSMRWGSEYSQSVNDKQRSDAQFLTDQGVNLVLGHGPHVLQPVTQLTGAAGNKTTVWYSLGNFLNTQLPPETLFNGVAIIHFDAKTKQVKTMAFMPTYMGYSWTAAQSTRQNRADLAARHNVELMPLQNANQNLIKQQQLKTTIAKQKQRLQAELSADGLKIPLVTTKDW